MCMGLWFVQLFYHDLQIQKIINARIEMYAAHNISSYTINTLSPLLLRLSLNVIARLRVVVI